MASKTISLRPMTTPSSSRVITPTSSRPFLPISSHNTILGVKPLKGVDGRKEGTSLLPEITYIAHLFIITSCCALFLLRIYMLPPIFIFKNTVARHPDCVLFLKKKNRSLTWFGGGLIGHSPLASLPFVLKNFFVRKNLGLCKKNGGHVKKILGHRKNMGTGEKYGPMMSTIYSMVTIVKTPKGYFLHNQIPNGRMTITVIITSIACCNRSI